MVSEGKKRRELAKLLSKLKGFRGSGTELITVYIPTGYPLAEISNKLRNEYGQAANIKSKSTKNNVQAALDKIIQYLKIFKQTPDNGLAIFCGNISKDPGRPNIELFALSPHQPLQIQMYRCDSEFQMEPLLMMGKVREKYGLVTIDGKDATVAILEGNVTKIVRRLTTTGPSKTTKGGSSAARYQRYVEELIENYYTRVGEAMDETLMTIGIKKVFVGGPGPVKDNFLKKKPFNYQFQILGVFDIGYVDDYGISELARKTNDVIAEAKAMREKKLIGEFMKEIAKEGLAVYGPKETMEALEKGRIGTLLMSEKFISKLLRIRCEKGDEEDIIIEREEEKEEIKCSKGHEVEFIGETDLFDQLYDKAEAKGIDVETIASDTMEGQQFLAGFKGIGAILKYK